MAFIQGLLYTLLVWMMMNTELVASNKRGIYYSQSRYWAIVPSSTPRDDPIIRVQPQIHPSGDNSHQVIRCTLEGGEKEGDAGNNRLLPFTMNGTSHWLYLLETETADPIDHNRRTGNYTLNVKCSLPPFHNITTVVITVVDDKVWSQRSCEHKDITQELCFGGVGRTIYAEEEASGLVLARFGNEVTVRKCVGKKRSFSVKDSRLRSKFEVRNGDLVLREPLDRETPRKAINKIALSIECNVTEEHGPAISREKRMLVKILDINDNGPTPYGAESTLKTSYRMQDGFKLNFRDRDSAAMNKYIIPQVDGFDVDFKEYPFDDGTTYYQTKLTLRRRDLAEIQPEINVTFIDTGMRPLIEGVTNKIVFTLRSQVAPSAISSPHVFRTTPVHSLRDRTYFRDNQKLNVSRHAARYTRLHSFLLHNEVYGIKPKYTLTKNYQSVFNITENTGILYVQNNEALAAVPERSIQVVVKVTDIGEWRVDIALNAGTNRASQTGIPCAGSCSYESTEESCSSACGVGAPEGKCHWRKCDGAGKDGFCDGTDYETLCDGAAYALRIYETCSPSLKHCPDKRCDELEQLVPELCPQDCAEVIEGNAKIINVSECQPPRGILEGDSPCWCGSADNCTCGKPHVIPAATTTATSTNTRTHARGQGVGSGLKVNGVKVTASNQAVGRTAPGSAVGNMQTHKLPDGDADLLHISLENCGSACRIVVVSVLTFTTCAIICLATGCHLHRKRKTGKMKMGSVISLSAAIPSDYVDDQDRPSGVISTSSVERALKNWEFKNQILPSLVSNSLYSPANSDVPMEERTLQTTLPPDPKWEIPRANLKLGRSLGEGEFGKVVRAQAINLNGRTGCTTVAVKMLKDCASVAEFRDLMSEYMLLKDVSHRNVIKLIGVCSQPGGPFYLVVEYCKHGSLRCYLRKCRINQEVYLGNDDFLIDSDNEDSDPDSLRRHDDISAKDLLSFSWQIANGMAYLCDMKLVHRDLAARNVLVTGDKMMKISDFGLTRDIYEGDAYFRKSKGRIPVKWMAPESLYDQVYTSKSDVWSFGVVLWEVVTLGAVPYPGVAPERLYHMLKTGYRMERPDNCSHLLFSIMERCWQRFPSERPSFKELSEIFENLLKSREDYLDLSFVIETPCSYEDDPITETGDIGSDPRPVPTTEEPEYGSINILTTDDDSYVVSPNAGSSGQKLRHNDVIYEGVLTSSDEADLAPMRRSRSGSVDETTSFLPGGNNSHKIA